MYIKKLDIHNFKNYEKASLSFSPKVNCFIGDNAAGKTNLLDAIYYLSFCKSYFNAVDTQNIRHDQEYFSILGEMDTDTNKTDLIHCVQKRNQKKSFKLNKKEYQRLADHIGKYPIVMISPYDRDLINEGSDVRRRFIDSIISQFNSLYLDNLIITSSIKLSPAFLFSFFLIFSRKYVSSLRKAAESTSTYRTRFTIRSDFVCLAIILPTISSQEAII
jgi:DNA replication and repair protein RecF